MVIFHSYVKLPEGILQFWTKTNPEGSGNFMEICFSWSSRFFLNLRSFSKRQHCQHFAGVDKSQCCCASCFFFNLGKNNKPPIWDLYIYIYMYVYIKKYLTTYKHGEIGDGLWHCFTTIHGFSLNAGGASRPTATWSRAPCPSLPSRPRPGDGLVVEPNPSEKWWTSSVGMMKYPMHIYIIYDNKYI